MNSSRSESVHTDGWGTAEETLRLIARLPAPEGLADRMQAGLRTAPRRGSLVGWPVAMIPISGWAQTAAFRGVAAAAIVCVVAGGGWRVYSHVPVKPTTRLAVMPARVGAGFSSAGAVHTPDTLAGPVLTHQVDAVAVIGKPVEASRPHAAHGTRHARHARPMAVAQ